MLILKKINTNFLFAVFFNIFMFLIFLFLFSPRLETNDDYYLGNIVSGAYGMTSHYMAYVNVILGYILSFFYWLENTINWWVICQYTLILGSMISLTYLLSTYYPKWLGRALGMIISICFGYELVVSLQYSKTTGFITVVAFLILFIYARKKLKIYWGIIGVVLALLGFLLRLESFFFVLPFCAFIWFYDVINIIMKKAYQELRVYVFPFAILFILILISFLFNHSQYKNNEEWNYWNVYNEARTELLDYGFPDYKENEETYKELGISKEDIVNYSILWNFDDSKVMSLNTLEKLVSLKESQKFNFALIVDSLKMSVITLDNKIVNLCMIIIFTVFFITTQKVKWVNLLVGIALFELLYLYLFYVGRYYAYRINILLWMGLLLILLLSFDQGTKSSESLTYRNAAICISICLFLWLCNVNYRDSSIAVNKAKGNNARNMMNYIEKDKANLYIVDCLTFSGTEYYSYHILKSVPYAKEENVYYLGGWLTNSPIWNNIKHQYNFDNPWKALYENSNVYLIDNIDIEGKLRYLHEHFDKELKYVLVNERYNYKIYKIYKD